MDGAWCVKIFNTPGPIHVDVFSYLFRLQLWWWGALGNVVI